MNPASSRPRNALARRSKRSCMAALRSLDPSCAAAGHEPSTPPVSASVTTNPHRSIRLAGRTTLAAGPRAPPPDLKKSTVRGRCVDVDEAPVVLGDALGRGIAIHASVEVALERVPPDRPSDGEADVAGNAGPLSQPVIDRRVVGAPTQHHAHDAIAAVRANESRDRLTATAIVDTFDLPHVGLHTCGSKLFYRPHHQARPQLTVVAIRVTSHGIELPGLRRHQQLEEILASALVQPLAQGAESFTLPFVHPLIPLGVPAHEHLGERGVEGLDVGAEVVPVLEVELVLSALLDRHGQDETVALCSSRRLGAELLVDQHSA